MTKLTPVQAIRRKCLECPECAHRHDFIAQNVLAGVIWLDGPTAVLFCAWQIWFGINRSLKFDLKNCPLYPYRLGCRPKSDDSKTGQIAG